MPSRKKTPRLPRNKDADPWFWPLRLSLLIFTIVMVGLVVYARTNQPKPADWVGKPYEEYEAHYGNPVKSKETPQGTLHEFARPQNPEHGSPIRVWQVYVNADGIITRVL